MAATLALSPRRQTLRRAATTAAALSVAGTILFFSQRYLHCFPAPKLFAQTVPLAFAAAAALAARMRAPRFPSFPFLAVLAWGGLAFARSQGTESFALSFLPLLSAAGIFWLSARLGSYPAERRRLLAAFVLAHLGCALYGIIQYFDLDPFTWSVDYGTGRAFSTIGNPNFLAGQMVLAFPVLLALAIGRDRLLGIFAQLTSVAAFTAFILAQTRGAMIGLGFGLGLGALLFWLRRGHPGRSGKLLLGPLIGVALIAFVFSVPSLNRTGISLPAQVISSLDLEQASARQRFFWWRGAALLFRTHPLAGIGLGNFPREFPRAARAIVPLFPDLRPAFCDHPHNDYLFVLCEQGIIGFGLLLWLAAAIIRRLLALGAKERGTFALGVLGGLAGVSVHAIWNMPFVIPSTLLSAGFLAGLAFAQPLPGPSRERGGPGNIPFRQLAPGFCVLVVGIALGYRPGIILAAQDYLNGARVMKEQKAFGPAAYLVRQSLKLTQAPWRQHFLLGGILYGQHYYSESLKAFQRDESENPWGADAILHQGKSLRQLGRYDAAEAECRRALKLVPNYTAAAVTIAVLDYFRARDARERGEEPAVGRHLKRADIWLNYTLRFFPRDAEALKVRGYVAVMAKQWERALRSWNDYLKAEPEDEEMRQRVAALETDLPRLRQGKPQRIWSGAAPAQDE